MYVYVDGETERGKEGSEGWGEGEGKEREKQRETIEDASTGPRDHLWTASLCVWETGAIFYIPVLRMGGIFSPNPGKFPHSRTFIGTGVCVVFLPISKQPPTHLTLLQKRKGVQESAPIVQHL